MVGTADHALVRKFEVSAGFADRFNNSCVASSWCVSIHDPQLMPDAPTAGYGFRRLLYFGQHALATIAVYIANVDFELHAAGHAVHCCREAVPCTGECQ